MAEDSNLRYISSASIAISRRQTQMEENRDKQTDEQKNLDEHASFDKYFKILYGSENERMKVRDERNSELEDKFTRANVAKKKDEESVSSDLVREALDFMNIWEYKMSSFKTKLPSFKSKQLFKSANVTCKKEQSHKTKVLSLVFFRASVHKGIDQLLLGTDINNIGGLNDICIRYKQEDEDAIIFSQVIHKYDTDDKRITFNDLWKEDGDLSLIKHFKSYLKIRQEFNVNNADVMFDGRYKDVKSYFILHTTLKDDLNDRKRVNDGNFKTRQTMKTLFITKEENSNIFQYIYQERDVHLLARIVLRDRLESIAKNLLQFKRECVNFSKMDDDFKMYHVVLSKKVLHSSFHPYYKFRCDFLTSDEEVMIMLREALYTEAVKEKLHKDEINERIRMILFYPNTDTISKLIGNVIKYDDQRKKLEIAEDEEESVDPELKEGLSELQVSRTVVRRAMQAAGFVKLSEMYLMLPHSFGRPMPVNSAIVSEKRLSLLATNIELLIMKSTDKSIIIDDTVIRTDKLVKGGARILKKDIVAMISRHLLVVDEEMKSYKFNMSDVSIRPKLYPLVRMLRSRIEDLESYRFLINLPGIPKLSLDIDAYDEGVVEDFFNNLWFFTDQSTENEMDQIAKEEMLEHAFRLRK